MGSSNAANSGAAKANAPLSLTGSNNGGGIMGGMDRAATQSAASVAPSQNFGSKQPDFTNPMPNSNDIAAQHPDWPRTPWGMPYDPARGYNTGINGGAVMGGGSVAPSPMFTHDWRDRNDPRYNGWRIENPYPNAGIPIQGNRGMGQPTNGFQMGMPSGMRVAQPLIGNTGSNWNPPESSVSPSNAQNMIMQYLNSLNNPGTVTRMML